MPKRETAHTIILMREGKRVKIKPNHIVDLTAEELDDIRKLAPHALKPVVEAKPAPEVKLPGGDDSKAAAGAKKQPAASSNDEI